MTKFSDFIRAPGTAGPPTQEGIRALGFALQTDFPVELQRYLWLGGTQTFTAGEKIQGRANLGVEIGVDVQAYSASLSSLAGVSLSANQLPYATGTNAWGATSLTAFGRSLIGAATSTAGRSVLGLGSLALQNDTALSVSGGSASNVVFVLPQGEFLRGLLTGSALSNTAGFTATRIDIAPGSSGSDGTTPVLMTQTSVLTKRLDAVWAVGSGNGGLDTGTAVDGTYHVWRIRRSDTGVVDALFSLSPTSPTMPAKYDQKSYLWPIVRSGGAIRTFKQSGNTFVLDETVEERSSAAAAAYGLLTLTSVPTGVVVSPILSAVQFQNAAGNASTIISSASKTVQDGLDVVAQTTNTGQSAVGFVSDRVFTDTSARINFSVVVNSGSLAAGSIRCHGWTFNR